MSHWFHRNALKATSNQDFSLKGVLSTDATSRIASQLRTSRAKLLELMTDSGNSLDIVEEEFTKYTALLQGFLDSQDPATAGKSKLRPLIRFKWTQTVQNGPIPLEANDAMFENLNMCTNMALWYTKHAARIAGNDEVSEEQALLVHRCLRKAAGVFSFVLAQKDTVSVESEKGQDLTDLVLAAYNLQSLAEAQEIVVARAIEKGNAPGLVSAIAHAAAKLFKKADDALTPLDPSLFEKWRVYLLLKQAFYLAYAYAFRGEALLKEDKCGEAVRACREGQKHLAEAERLCVSYKKARGPKSTKAAQCETHLFFRRLSPILIRHLEKAERENGFIYHHKVPEECPTLDDDPKYGLVSAIEFQPPPPDPLWAPHVYQAFDITKAPMPDFNQVFENLPAGKGLLHTACHSCEELILVEFEKGKKGEKEVGEVKEAPIYQTAKDPSNTSGCSVS